MTPPKESIGMKWEKGICSLCRQKLVDPIAFVHIECAKSYTDYNDELKRLRWLKEMEEINKISKESKRE